MIKPPKQLVLARGDFVPLWENSPYRQSPSLAGSQTLPGSRATCVTLCHVPFEVCAPL